jgi:hypothetical protein
MTSQHDKPKQWRPRFSVRTLVIVVTLVCCYAACWGPTKTQGVQDVLHRISGVSREHYIVAVTTKTRSGNNICYGDATARLPLLTEVLVIEYTTVEDVFTRRYYFWFFGYVAKLPFEREI